MIEGGRWLYHLVVRRPLPEGRYAPESLAREGFVHCSYAAAVAESARLYFATGADVVAWRIDPARLDVPVDVAATPRGAMPHVRGSVAREAIVAVCERGAWEALADRVSGVTLLTPGRDRLLRELLRNLEHRPIDRVDVAVSFIMRSGIALLSESLTVAMMRGARVRVLTTDYLNISEPTALGWLLDRSGRELSVKFYSEPGRSFHPKAYIFRSGGAPGGDFAIVGSSNLSRSALVDGVEWNLGVREVAPLVEEFNVLWTSRHALPLTRDWLAEYARRPRPVAAHGPLSAEATAPEAPWAPTPNAVQLEALRALEATRREGHTRALVVLATGLGKTWLAAFDSSPPTFRRVLFIAHRDELLTQARDTFRLARPDARLTLFHSGSRDLSGDVVFASVLSLRGALAAIAPDAFDYVVVDEFHHAHAGSYRDVLSHLQPRFLLGLTATPVRMDGADIAALCDDNVLRVCGLVEGIQRGLLAPFTYRGVRDLTDLSGVRFERGRFAERELGLAVSTEERARLAFKEWRAMGAQRTLGFCVTTEHADFMAAYFRERGAEAVAVHSGTSSAGRGESLERLTTGALAVLFAVDLFNEGLDVPLVDGVLMLRPTESPVVFQQQLGRGLRVAPGKDRLLVVDLVANHRSALLKARILAAIVTGEEGGTARENLARLKGPLPEGVTLDIGEIHGLLTALASGPEREPLHAFLDSWIEEHGVRPSLLQTALGGPPLTHGPVKRLGWAGWLKASGPTQAPERTLDDTSCRLLHAVQRLPLNRSFTTVALERFAALGGTTRPVRVDALALACRDSLLKDAHLRRDLARVDVFDDLMQRQDVEWIAWWRAEALAPLLLGENGRVVLREESDSVSLGAVAIASDQLTVGALLDEILAWRRWAYVSSLRLVFRGGDGRELDAEFSVEGQGAAYSITIESRGGERGSAHRRNTQYDSGLDLCLERLATLSARLVEVSVVSHATRGLSSTARSALPGDGRVVPLGPTTDLRALRRELTTLARRVGQAPGVSGGNAQKRLRLSIELPTPRSAADFERLLAWGTDIATPPS